MEMLNILNNKLDAFADLLNKYLWGWPMIIFLLIVHILLTILTKGVQRKILLGIKLSVSKSDGGKGDVSIFGALSTALASTVGTGNIIGVGTAIVLGGPGAVLWTWLIGIFGIATKYTETFIAVKHRHKLPDGTYIGGAMTALEDLKKPILATIFAIVAMLTAFGIGCGVQSNAIAELLNNNFAVPNWITGIVLAILTFIVIFGGIKSIANVCTKLVPIMSILYSIGCIVILIMYGQYLPQTITIILNNAFTGKALVGGFVGAGLKLVLRYGCWRGLYSNEAGMGSAPIGSAASETKNAVLPAIVGSTGVFWDTVVICLLSGLVLCVTVVANPEIDATAIDGALLCSKCFEAIPYIGMPILVFGVLTFAYSTILGWNYYATQCVRYLFKSEKACKIYLFIWIIVIFLGTTMDLSTVWAYADVLNALMVIPNVIAIFFLRKEIVKDTTYYLYENHLDEIDESMQ